MFSSKVLNVCLLFGCLLVLVAAQPPLTPRKCPRNESYLPCGPSCQTECATLNQVCLIRHFRCPDGCYCNEGYARDSAGECIPLENCPKRGPD